MKNPLETGHVDRIIKDICDYIELVESAEAKRRISYLLDVLEDDAKRALQKALSIPDSLLQYIDSPSDVVYESNLGIHESDDTYLLSTSICTALDIILSIKTYHYLNDMRSEEDKYSFMEMIKNLRDKVIIYRGIELEEESHLVKQKQSDGGKGKKADGSKISKGPVVIPSLIGKYVRADINVRPKFVWNAIISLIRQKNNRLEVVLNERTYCIYQEKDYSTDDVYLCEDSDGMKEPERIKYHSAFEDHVRKAKKYFRNKKKVSV